MFPNIYELFFLYDLLDLSGLGGVGEIKLVAARIPCDVVGPGMQISNALQHLSIFEDPDRITFRVAHVQRVVLRDGEARRSHDARLLPDLQKFSRLLKNLQTRILRSL